MCCRLLKRFVNAAVVERASIDEAFILCQPPVSAGRTVCRSCMGTCHMPWFEWIHIACEGALHVINNNISDARSAAAC
jgi:nucleotidyltransferase/DNA polymerase involved in DNA repair